MKNNYLIELYQNQKNKSNLMIKIQGVTHQIVISLENKLKWPGKYFVVLDT